MRERPLPAVITAAVVIGLLGAVVAAASVTGWPKELFSVATAEAGDSA